MNPNHVIIDEMIDAFEVKIKSDIAKAVCVTFPRYKLINDDTGIRLTWLEFVTRQHAIDFLRDFLVEHAELEFNEPVSDDTLLNMGYAVKIIQT